MNKRWFEQFTLQSPEGGSEGGGGGAGGSASAGVGAGQGAADPAAGTDSEGEGDDVTRLRHTLDRERTANRDKDRRLGALEAQLRELTTTNPEAVREAQAKAQQEQTRRELIEQQAALAQREMETKYSAQLVEARTELNAERTARQRELVRQQAEKAFIGAKGSTVVSEIDRTTPFDEVWGRFGNHFLLENDSLVVVDANGNPEIDPDTGKRFEPVKWLGRLQGDTKWGRLFEPAMGAGGGARSSRDGRVPTGKDLMTQPLGSAFSDAFG